MDGSSRQTTSARKKHKGPGPGPGRGCQRTVLRLMRGADWAADVVGDPARRSAMRQNAQKMRYARAKAEQERAVNGKCELGVGRRWVPAMAFSVTQSGVCGRKNVEDAFWAVSVVARWTAERRDLGESWIFICFADGTANGWEGTTAACAHRRR